MFVEQAKYQLYFEFIASITLMNGMEISWKKYFAWILSIFVRNALITAKKTKIACFTSCSKVLHLQNTL